MASPRDLPTLDLVAVILAAGVALSLLGMISGVIYVASLNPERRTLSENLTQVLTGLTGGVIGILGGLVGYRIGNGRPHPQD